MVVGQGLRFALARVVSRPKAEDKQRAKTNGPSVAFTCLQSYATVSTTFLETAQRVVAKSRQHYRPARLSTSHHDIASQSTHEYPFASSPCPLLRADVLEELDWSMGIDVDTSSKTRPSVGHAAELFLDLWEYLLVTCENMLHSSADATTSTVDFGEKMKWEKSELVIVKIMERREFNKVYEAFRASADAAASDNNHSSSATTPRRAPKKKAFLHRTHSSKSSSSTDDPPLPFSSDPNQLLTTYLYLLHRTLRYASHTDIRSIMASTIYNSVVSIAFCRFPHAQALLLDTFDAKGFNGSTSGPRKVPRHHRRSSMAKRTFFEDDNPALFGWHLDDILHVQPSLQAIDECLYATLTQLLDATVSARPPARAAHHNNNNETDDPDTAVPDEGEPHGGQHPDAADDPLEPSPVHAQSTLCVSMFLALWIAMTHHILRTSRGHIPWRDIPAYRHLHDRGLRLFEKAYTLQTLECDDDSNLVRFDMMHQRRMKVDADFPIEILYPQVVFATSTKIVGLTQSPHDFMAILFKHTASPYVRAVPACVGHLEQWLAVLPMEVFQDPALHQLFVQHVRKMLFSDRVDRLKAILVFLLHSVGLFDMTLQSALFQALHDAFDHLFRHWFRDVRFCYHLVLLYLFGDRRQLGSRSDAILLGLDTDIVALQRHPLWLPFDERLLDALEGCRSATRTTPYDRTSFNEYIGQLEHYHQNAESLPDGEAVPIPRIKLQQPASRGG